MNNQEQLLTCQQVCEWLSVSRPTIYRLTKSGQFPAAIRIGRNGRQIRYRASDIEIWLQEQQDGQSV